MKPLEAVHKFLPQTTLHCACCGILVEIQQLTQGSHLNLCRQRHRASESMFLVAAGQPALGPKNAVM